jgi:hypothetical protein
MKVDKRAEWLINVSSLSLVSYKWWHLTPTRSDSKRFCRITKPQRFATHKRYGHKITSCHHRGTRSTSPPPLPFRCRRWPLLFSSIHFSQPFKHRWRYRRFGPTIRPQGFKTLNCSGLDPQQSQTHLVHEDPCSRARLTWLTWIPAAEPDSLGSRGSLQQNQTHMAHVDLLITRPHKIPSYLSDFFPWQNPGGTYVTCMIIY